MQNLLRWFIKVRNSFRKEPQILLLFFLLGVALASFYWWGKVKDSNSYLEYKQFEIKNLQEQVGSLREDAYSKWSPSPTPTIIPFVQKEDLSEDSVYKLDCFEGDKKASYNWIDILKRKLSIGEELGYVCFNERENKTAFISKKEIDPGGMGRPGIIEFTIAIYDIENDKVKILKTSQGNYLGGYCNKIVNWSHLGLLYYQCGGGDGPWGNYSIYKVDVNTPLSLGIVESCSTFNEQTICTNHCQSNRDCQQGYFCNLENSTCVKYCSDRDVCAGGSCVAFGPVKGCTR